MIRYLLFAPFILECSDIESYWILDIQDVSQLMDICRQSIIFDDIDGISSCLKAIHYDADIALVQVRLINLNLNTQVAAT